MIRVKAHGLKVLFTALVGENHQRLAYLGTCTSISRTVYHIDKKGKRQWDSKDGSLCLLVGTMDSVTKHPGQNTFL